MDYESQYVNETGDKKPKYHNDLASYNYLTIEWYKCFSKWLIARLEKAEGENKEFPSKMAQEIKNL